MEYATVTLLTHGSKFVGINLDAEPCAEHEYGVGPLKVALGITHRKDLDFTKGPEVCFEEAYSVKKPLLRLELEHHVVIGQYNPSMSCTPEEYTRIVMRFAQQVIKSQHMAKMNERVYPRDILKGMWSTRGFFVAAKLHCKQADLLDAFYEASLNQDLLLSGAVLDQRTGLTFAKQSQLDRVGRARVRELKAQLQPQE